MILPRQPFRATPLSSARDTASQLMCIDGSTAPVLQHSIDEGLVLRGQPHAEVHLLVGAQIPGLPLTSTLGLATECSYHTRRRGHGSDGSSSRKGGRLSLSSSTRQGVAPQCSLHLFDLEAIRRLPEEVAQPYADALVHHHASNELRTAEWLQEGDAWVLATLAGQAASRRRARLAARAVVVSSAESRRKRHGLQAQSEEQHEA